MGDTAGLLLNPFLAAAWFGLLVTSLNLLPVGQLDGGHATYALFGARAHGLLGRAAFTGMLLLAPLGWLWHGVPSGFLYVLLLFFMLRVRHPNALDESDPLGRPRALVALLTLLVFILSFTPFPLTLQ
jgi:membrane-associated protease RseP (regulator of RpoE activity)